MRQHHWIAVVAVLIGTTTLSGGLLGQAPPIRPLAPVPQSGLWVSPSMEGWYANEDGTYTISFGYNNRDEGEVVEIPLGPDNFIEPAEFDGLQPTVFASGHVRGAFGVTIPAEMRGEDVVWTLRNRGRTLKVPGRVGSSAYQLDWTPRPQGSVSPVIRFDEDGPEGRGPAGLTAEEALEARVGVPVELAVWARDPSVRDPDDFRSRNVPVTLGWHRHQGPGEVTFEPLVASAAAADEDGRATAGRPGVDQADEEEMLETGPNQVAIAGGEGWGVIRATFDEPGEYLLRVLAENFEAIDSAPSQQCCWTNGYVRVVVSP